MRELSQREKSGYPYTSKVVYRKGTQGTETSKYLQEKKEKKSILWVVASESGRAQTGFVSQNSEKWKTKSEK